MQVFADRVHHVDLLLAKSDLRPKILVSSLLGPGRELSAALQSSRAEADRLRSDNEVRSLASPPNCSAGIGDLSGFAAPLSGCAAG